MPYPRRTIPSLSPANQDSPQSPLSPAVSDTESPCHPQRSSTTLPPAHPNEPQAATGHIPPRRPPLLRNRHLDSDPVAPTVFPPPIAYPCAAHRCPSILFRRSQKCSGGVLCRPHERILKESCQSMYSSWHRKGETVVGLTPVDYVMCQERMVWREEKEG